jgi:hypothetical protein
MMPRYGSWWLVKKKREGVDGRYESEGVSVLGAERKK